LHQSLLLFYKNNKGTSFPNQHIIVAVRTQFSKDDVDASDSLLVGLCDDDFNGDGGVWVD
jgi:hypothetical protein